jgi:DNA-binding Xre family transcriptional regulator
MLSLNLTPIFKARGIERPFTFLRKIGFPSHTATAILNNTYNSLRLNQIELLCSALVCEPNDLFKWSPDKDKQYPNNHPLFKLQQQINITDIKETLATIPYNQLKEITKQINGLP